MHRISIVLIATALALSACSMTPTQKKWTAFAAGVLVVGAIAAHDAENGKLPRGGAITEPSFPCRPQPDGSCR